MRSLTRSSDRHIAALDGLRAAAIGLVLLYHLTPMRDSNHGLRTLLFKIADIGWSGVDLFFVLSGFLITTKLLEARDDPHRFRDFYVRRALRILPLYYGVVLVLVMIGRPSLQAQLPYWLYYSNFVSLPLPTDAGAPIGHFWSLAIEEQFYFLWPAVVFLCSRRTAIAVCALLAIAAPLLRFAFASLGAHWAVTYGWTPMRADGLVLGALIALLGTNRRIAWIALAAGTPLVAWAAWRDQAYLIVHNATHSEGLLVRALLPSAVSVSFAAILILSLEYQPRFLGAAPLRATARYSYGIYVAHFMIVPALFQWLPLAGLTRNSASLLFFVAGSAISFALAALSFHAYESFFLRLKSRLA
jgi:peptidoglycan/LPS O-acetylase OafA/YrhL